MKIIVYFVIAVIVLGMLILQHNSSSDKNPNDRVTVGDPTYTDIIFGKPSEPNPFPGMYD